MPQNPPNLSWREILGWLKLATPVAAWKQLVGNKQSPTTFPLGISWTRVVYVLYLQQSTRPDCKQRLPKLVPWTSLRRGLKAAPFLIIFDVNIRKPRCPKVGCILCIGHSSSTFQRNCFMCFTSCDLARSESPIVKSNGIFLQHLRSHHRSARSPWCNTA